MDKFFPDWKEQFTSDNTSAICPAAWNALAEANHLPEVNYAIGYGDDSITTRAKHMICDLFETDCEVFFVFTGTAANALALSTICQSFHDLFAYRFSHVATDEANAPEFYSGGAKILAVDVDHGKINPAQIVTILDQEDRIHSANPRGITITQSTGYGTLYTVDEILQITSLKKRYLDRNLKVHMDGARFANALAAMPTMTPKEITWKAGIDVLTFGATKNGGPGTEAVIFFDHTLCRDFDWRRKQLGQLASKMRYLSAPWIGLLESDAWRTNAAHANRQAKMLSEGLSSIPGISLAFPTESNVVFARLPDGLAGALHQRGWQFHQLDRLDTWRFMCCWSTSEKAVNMLLADVRDITGT